jgi:Tfp pilus assembly protein PilF
MEAAMVLGSSRFITQLVVVITLLAAAATAQRGGGSKGPTGGPTGTPSRNTPSISPNSNPLSPSTTDRNANPLFISGKVLLEGGGPLPEPVPIERVCNGTTRREAYADTKGQFGFQLGSNFTFQDASEDDGHTTSNSQPRNGNNYGVKPNELNGCELRAVLAGYQSTAIILQTAGAESWQYEVGTIFLKRIGNAPGTTISVTSMAAPKGAMHAYEKAQKMMAEKPAEAEKELNKAVKSYPQFAAAWTLLGDIHRQRNQFDAAQEEYAQAIAADPQFVNPNYGLAVIAVQQKKWDDVVRFSDQVIKLNPVAFPMAYFLNAAANYNLQKLAPAEENAKRFKSMDAQHSHPDVCLLLSYLYSAKQDYAGAAHEIREYLSVRPNSPDAESLKNQAKRFEDLSVSAKRD